MFFFLYWFSFLFFLFHKIRFEKGGRKDHGTCHYLLSMVMDTSQCMSEIREYCDLRVADGKYMQGHLAICHVALQIPQY